MVEWEGFKFEHLPDPTSQASIYGLVRNDTDGEDVRESGKQTGDQASPESTTV
jgi:hypothetical protein